jgi:hypothetical protein
MDTVISNFIFSIIFFISCVLLMPTIESLFFIFAKKITAKLHKTTKIELEVIDGNQNYTYVIRMDNDDSLVKDLLEYKRKFNE